MVDDRVLFEKLWSAILQNLKLTLSSAQYETWIADTTCLDYTEDRLLIEAPNVFVRDWLETHCKTKVQAAIEQTIGHQMEVAFVVEDSESKQIELESNSTDPVKDCTQIIENPDGTITYKSSRYVSESEWDRLQTELQNLQIEMKKIKKFVGMETD